MSPPTIGQMVKVWLPGESPWAECVEVHHDGTWCGRIDNHLLNTEEHGLVFNDSIVFRRESGRWVPE